MISATSSPSSKGDVLSVTESKDTKPENIDGGRCFYLGYLPEGIANSACDVVSMGACSVVTVASSALSSSSIISKSRPIGKLFSVGGINSCENVYCSLVSSSSKRMFLGHNFSLSKRTTSLCRHLPCTCSIR